MPRRRESRAGELTEVKLVVPGDRSMVDLLGRQDELLKVVEAEFDASIIVRGNEITITGEPHETEVVGTLFAELLKLVAAGQELTRHHVGQAIDLVRASGPSPSHVLGDTLLVHRGKAIRPKTAGQKRYVDAIRKHTVTFSIGPAGTGKTYLAMAMAVAALAERDVSRIILTRPAVEAGEKLGYLPGTLFEKVDPYLRPLYDALFDMMDPEAFQKHMDRGTIEVAPLAFMRGRTLNDSFIILDEAQNTSPEQMKMFLTRLGFGSKAVVTGDVTQIDLPTDTTSGLKLVQEILSDIGGIAFCHLAAKDVVRHELVQRIVEAYKVHDEGRGRPG